MKQQDKFPPGWKEERVRRVLTHYENQTDEEAVAEDEAAFELEPEIEPEPEGQRGQTIMEIPQELVPKVRALIAECQC
ncbi:hypothetical protein B6V00_02085 [ANME-1 cluster archaeon ex4572_4]|nr:hypothetical protein [Methanophagales archaeon]OYT67015.1 MAG: hypothetical protein B6V00_02085 [ANME-1 cluster archaeon ex4572_4]PXF50996.1 MAG: hypothetical protein C4B55_00790 [Methanophagales archaeon]